jgi:multiple sugar transport system substrate-binding protein
MGTFRPPWVSIANTIAIVSAVVFSAVPVMAQVQIRLQTWQWNQQPTVKALEEFQRTFNAANPGIQVVREDSRYGDKEAVFTSQSQAKAAADVAHFSIRPIRNFADHGFLLDLTPFVEKEGGAKFLAQWDPAALEMCRYKGKLYCLPDNLDPVVLMYNTEHFKQAGLNPDQPPTTWEQFLDYAKKLTRSTRGDGKIDRWGVGILGAREEGVFMRFDPWMWGAGGDYLTPDGKRSVLDTPEALEGFKYYVELFTKHKVVPAGVIEQGAQNVRTQLAHEVVSMILNFSSEPYIVNAINPQLHALDVLRWAPLPVGKKRVTAAWFSVRVISAFTKHPDEAWKVYKAWYARDQQMLNFKNDAFMSTRLDVRNSPEVKGHKFAPIALAQAPYVKWDPLIPEWPKIGDAVLTAIQEALTGVKTPEQALRDANAAANRALGVQ